MRKRKEVKISKKLQDDLDEQEQQINNLRNLFLETIFGRSLRDLILIYDALGIDLDTTKDQFECYTSDLFKSIKEFGSE